MNRDSFSSMLFNIHIHWTDMEKNAIIIKLTITRTFILTEWQPDGQRCVWGGGRAKSHGNNLSE